MCELCDGSLTLYEERARESARIRAHGWTMVGVGDTDPLKVFCYTIGLSAVPHPELFTLGVPPGDAARIFGELAPRVARGGLRLAAGTALPLRAGDVYLTRMRSPGRYLLGAVGRYGPGVRGLHVSLMRP
jgi:hypothetical protein